MSTLGISTSGSRRGPAYHPILDVGQQLPMLTFGLSAPLPPSTEAASQSWTKIFPIGKDCGVNLQTPVFQFKEESDTRREYQLGFEVQQLRKTNHSKDLRKNVPKTGYLSPTLTAVATKGICKEGNEHAMFVIGLCSCEACCKKKVNTLQVEPMLVTMKLRYFKDIAKTVVLPCFPGVTSEFTMKEEVDGCHRDHFVYYSSFLPLSALNIHSYQGEYGVMYVFEDRREGEASRFMSKWTPSVIEIAKIVRMEPLPKHELLKQQYEQKMKVAKPDMDLVSSDGKGFPCHKAVLSDKSPVFEEYLTRIEQATGAEVKMVSIPMSEDSFVTEVFLKSVYYRDDKLINSLDFKMTVGVLKLACEYQLMNLVGMISISLVRKLQADGFIRGMESLWKLCNLFQANRTMQIVVQLKEKLLVAVTRMLRQTMFKRIKLSEDANPSVIEVESLNMIQDFLQQLNLVNQEPEMQWKSVYEESCIDRKGRFTLHSNSSTQRFKMQACSFSAMDNLKMPPLDLLTKMNPTHETMVMLYPSAMGHLKMNPPGDH